ncbi:MAG: Tex family protein [Clostridia bacterium]
MNINEILKSEFGLKKEHIENIIGLIDDGCTIPFIARYRKEMTGTCDDQVLRELSERLLYLRNLEKRKDEIVSSITEQEKMTDEILNAIKNAKTMTEVEDIYRPFKQKRKTRASVAIAKGLQPLADILFLQETKEDLCDLAISFVDEEKGVNSVADALSGAKDIVAEAMSDNAEIRKILREKIFESSKLVCELVENENSKTYETYKEFSQSVKILPSHRILAINRGEKEKCLKVKIDFDSEIAFLEMKKMFLKNNAKTNDIICEIIADSFARLIFPSLENECRNNLTDFANEQAIKMFELNLKPLLMQAPLKNNIILGLDPAYRTGCKIAVIDKNGQCLDTTVIYPTPPQSKTAESIAKLKTLIEKYGVNIISIGNGTASKESEIFVADLIRECEGRDLNYAIVNEAGASVYSASKLGAEEFPEFDVSLRSAISIARRLQDPLAELIKIDVKSIGVGQYQHDMPQGRLGDVLGGVVEDCVNSVGVDLNTASPSLLSYVSGLNASIAKNICEFRLKNKSFKNRKELLKVAKLGPKAFQQCAGFLRISDGENILDNTSVHPESYDATKKLLALFKLSEDDVKDGNLGTLQLLISSYGKAKVCEKISIGEMTLDDIVKELLKPGRDIREEMPKPVLRSDLLSLNDLHEGMIVSGTVRNVIDFGAFVDIGVHQDGLVHISQICDKFIKHPSEVLKVGDCVQVKIISIDIERKRIALTMKGF